MTRTHLGMAFLLATCVPAPAATPGVTTIANPGGGTIAYAQLPQQHTAQGAMGKVLQYVESNFGARPTIGKYMKSPDGNSLAATFTVTNGGTAIAGLALVAVSATGPGAGAVLSDTEDHLRTSLKPMLARLQQEAVAKGGSAAAQAAIATAGGANAGGSSSAASAASAARPSAASPAASAAPLKPSAPAEKLTQTTFPDGSGSIGLPAGWKITAARQGDVIASGPHGEGLRFGMAQSAIDYSNPQSRALGRGPGGTAPGNFVAIPFGTPGDAAFKEVIAQLTQKMHKPAPVIDYAVVKTLPSQGSGKNYFMQGTTTAPTGSAATWIEVMEGAMGPAGVWQIDIFQITVPDALADQEANTVASIFKTYRTNDAVIMGQISSDENQVQQITRNYMVTSKKMADISERSTQAESNYLLGNTVIRDGDLNAHGTVSDDVANALIAADPNRFQAVSSGNYVKGIDY
jgi:hypothetical protein